MASRKRKHTETTTPEEQKKALVCVVHFQGLAGKSFAHFSDSQRPENILQKLQYICKRRRTEPVDSPYRVEDSCNQVPGELKPEHSFH